MADQSSRVIETLKKHAKNMQSSAETAMEVENEETNAERAAYEARLDRTVRDLQEQVLQQEHALEKLRSSSTAISPLIPTSDPTIRLRQLRTVKAAYESLTTNEPTLSPKDSPIPALLAFRNTKTLILETKTAIQTLQSRLASSSTRLKLEESENRSARLLTNALESRIDRIRLQQHELTKKSHTQIAKDLVREQQTCKDDYEMETKRLVKAFNDFVDTQLASMLAAEELGGPVVGEMMDISEETLEAGFSLHGQVKRRSSKASNQDLKRQQRIDQIWGPATHESDEEADDSARRTEKEAAGAEMRALTEALLNTAAGGMGSGGYVELSRDSAASRFLVRAKAAQFHPKDARMLRLLDFGREIDG